MRENIDKLHEDIILITERLREHARTTPDRLAYTFLRDDGKIDELTYGQLERRATALAGALAARAPAGARALLLYPAGLEFITVYLACLLAGIIAVPATIPHKSRASRRLKALLEDADPVLILTRSDNEPAIQHSLSLVEAANRACLCTDLLAGDAADIPDAELDAIRTRLPQPTPESVAFLQYTSGSTSLPKGVEVTHANLAANVASIRDGFGFDPSTVMVSWLPLFHDMGLIGSVVSPLHVGFHCVLMAPAAFLKHPLGWLEAITRYRGTCAGAPNFGWDYCAAKIRDEHKAGLDLSSLSVAYNGSEPIRAATLRAFVDAFAAQGMRESALFPCYGMAETTLFVSGGPRGRGPLVRTVSKSLLEGNQIRDAQPGDPDAREIVSSGRIGLSTRVRVVDPETSLPVSSHRVGEIWVAGPSVARGYWHRLEQTEATFGATLANGNGERWLRTGDLGFLRDGELFITGRLKDLVIINGRNVYPQDIEEVIEQAIDFIEPNMCAAFSVEIGGQERLAIVAEANRSLVRAAQQIEKELGHDEYMARFEATVQHIRTVIAQQFDVAVASIVFVKPGAFPRTTSGKVQRGRARELALHGELEVVYVMPGSIFDRRTPRDLAQAATLPAGAGAPADAAPDAAAAAAPVAPAATVAAQSAAAQPVPTVDAERERSRHEADAMIAWLRRYAERRLNSRVIDERRTIPPYVVLDLGNAGFFGLQAPRRFGGKELTTVDLMRVMEQLAAIDVTVATMVGVHNGLGIRPLLRFGSDAQQERLLPALAGGRRLGAFALTEPGAGSNPMALRASAVKTAGGWRVQAEKQWIGLASWAGLTTLFAKASTADGTPLGMISLLVDADTEGLTQGPESLTMGMRGMVQNTLFLRDAFVPDDAVLLAPGDGMDAAHDAMLFSRLGIGAICVGAMKRCAQLIARYAGRRTVGTGLLAENAVSVVRLQGLTASIAACEALVLALAAQIDAGAAPGAEVYVACKAAATEALGDAADLLVQMLGGRGYIESNGAPQILRDARVMRILEGPTETLYAHLGASLAKPGCASRAFLAGPLKRAPLAAELDAAVARVGELADGAERLFGSRGAARQWIDYRLGELAAGALLLGAAEQAQESEHDGARALAASHAVVWARRRFNALLQALLAELAAQRPYSSAADLAAVVAGYAESIGDVDQTLPGEDREVDALLRRAAPAPAFAPASAHAPAPTLAHAPAHASAALRAQVHDSILHWLRGEGRRDVHAVDFDVSFATLGMDSLATATIAVDLEQRLGMAVVPEVLFDYPSINELAVFLERQRESGAPAAARYGTPA
ncbi:AMP-binding protein [Massilia sp. 9096]|uniref:AMP-binding protein n=1 Tax=Massilia sp. 9096 TaxID=1500894 RepID=UPI000691D577|nr:AMP-binding protein [Massilia sp. 9096]